jgi:lipoprotein-anchoring transpeptidase ErfK/SrfK
MIRWVVRLLLIATVVWGVVFAVHSGSHGSSRATRLVVDQAAQPATAASHAAATRPKSAEVVSSQVCDDVTAAREIVVSIKLQKLWACAGTDLYLTTSVTTGAIDRDWATPKGTWKIYAKQTNRWLSGPGYSVQVRYWMPFWGGYGVHDSPWQRFPYGSSLYRSRGSHGCVQVPGATMAKLFAWAQVGSTVHVEA